MNIESIKQRAFDRIARAETSSDEMLVKPWREILETPKLDEDFIHDLCARYPKHVI